MVDAAGAIAEPLRDDAFAAESAGVLEDGRAVAVEMLVEGDTVAGVAEQIGEHGLAALDRLPAKVLAVEFDQIEGAEHGGMVVMPIAERSKIERPSSSTTMASPSSAHDRTGRLATAAAIFG